MCNTQCVNQRIVKSADRVGIFVAMLETYIKRAYRDIKLRRISGKIGKGVFGFGVDTPLSNNWAKSRDAIEPPKYIFLDILTSRGTYI